MKELIIFLCGFVTSFLIYGVVILVIKEINSKKKEIPYEKDYYEESNQYLKD